MFYKRQGETSEILDENDFCLVVMNKFQQLMLTEFGSNAILIDGTHGFNNYEFELTTIMVIDEFGQGFPAAFMFSNKKNTNIYKLFFKSIHKKVGNINAKVFMSDITDTFYNAWQQVMGNVRYRLLCSWHVDRAWQKNLSKINNKKKRSEVYKTLKVLQEELNENFFENKLASAVNLMLTDKDTENFGQYFVTNYVSTSKQWAYCYRKGTGINTNMRLESMHKTIKYFYLNRRVIKRLDKGLHMVLKYVRDQSIKRVIKIVKGNNTKCHKENYKRHKFAKASKFSVQVVNDSSWEMKGDSNIYLIKKLRDESCCKLACPECRVCIHMYSCSCEDYLHNFILCKHIHFLKLHNLSANTNSTDLLPERVCSKGNDSFIDLLDNHTQQNNNLNNKVNQTFLKLQQVNFNNLDESIILEVHMHLNILNNLVDLPKVPDTFISRDNNGSFNKNIVPQMRFFSTQKKRKQGNSHNKKPCKKQKAEINNILNGNLTEFISSNPNHDHSYL